jgi:hypothetical protein
MNKTINGLSSILELDPPPKKLGRTEPTEEYYSTSRQTTELSHDEPEIRMQQQTGETENVAGSYYLVSKLK